MIWYIFFTKDVSSQGFFRRLLAYIISCISINSISIIPRISFQYVFLQHVSFQYFSRFSRKAGKDAKAAAEALCSVLLGVGKVWKRYCTSRYWEFKFVLVDHLSVHLFLLYVGGWDFRLFFWLAFNLSIGASVRTSPNVQYNRHKHHWSSSVKHCDFTNPWLLMYSPNDGA